MQSWHSESVAAILRQGPQGREGLEKKDSRVPVLLAQCRWTQEGEVVQGCGWQGEGVGAGDGDWEQAHLGQALSSLEHLAERGRRPAGRHAALAACQDRQVRSAQALADAAHQQGGP